MDETSIKIGAMDVDVYPSHAGYRPLQLLDEYGPSTSNTFGFNNFPAPLHVTETRFIMESLDAVAPRHGYPDFQQTYKPSAMQQLPPPSGSLPRAVSAPASISGSHRSSDSDIDDADADDGDVDTSTLTKEELRKHKNRQSAARSRKRSRDRMGQLEALVRQLSAKNRQLEEQVQALLLERAAVERHSHIPPQPQHHQFHAPPQQHPAPHQHMHTQYY